MNQSLMYLPIASIIEILGILTLLTNDSVVGPIEIGFKVPYVVSANLQGFGLFIAGSILSIHVIRSLK